MDAVHTKRLRLEPLSAQHASVMHKLCVDPEVRRYLFEGHIIPLEQVEETIAHSQACFSQQGIGFFGLYLDVADDPNTGEFVGFCGLRVFANGDDMELLMGMQPRFWGNGYGQEAAREVLSMGFDRHGLERVVAATDTPNQRSVRVLQRLGMSFRERREWHGLDTMFYELTATDFKLI